MLPLTTQCIGFYFILLYFFDSVSIWSKSGEAEKYLLLLFLFYFSVLKEHFNINCNKLLRDSLTNSNNNKTLKNVLILNICCCRRGIAKRTIILCHQQPKSFHLDAGLYISLSCIYFFFEYYQLT